MNKDELELNEESFVLGDTVLFEYKTKLGVKIKRNFFVAHNPPIFLLTINSCFIMKNVNIGRVFPLENSNGKFSGDYFYLIGFNSKEVKHCRMLLTEKSVSNGK